MEEKAEQTILKEVNKKMGTKRETEFKGVDNQNSQERGSGHQPERGENCPQ